MCRINKRSAQISNTEKSGFSTVIKLTNGQYENQTKMNLDIDSAQGINDIQEKYFYQIKPLPKVKNSNSLNVQQT